MVIVLKRANHRLIPDELNTLEGQTKAMQACLHIRCANHHIETIEQILQNWHFDDSSVTLVDLLASLNYLRLLSIEVMQQHARSNTGPRTDPRDHGHLILAVSTNESYLVDQWPLAHAN